MAVLGFTATLTLFTPSTANAAEGCVISVAGIKVCGRLLTPLPTVTIKPDAIRLPGSVVTVRPDPVQVPVPGPTRTVEIPGDTKTVTIRPDNPQPSQRPVLPQPTETVTVTPDAVPDQTGQPAPVRGTVAPSPEPEVETVTETRTKTETIIRRVLLGTLVSIAFTALGILALFLGYIMGQKDAKKNEDRFLESLRDTVRLNKRPN